MIEFVGEYHASTFRRLPSSDGAQGVLFVCPKCGNHSVLIWFANPKNAPVVPEYVKPKSRWTFSGEIENLTINPSIDLSKVDEEHPAHESRCYWHGWLVNGKFL